MAGPNPKKKQGKVKSYSPTKNAGVIISGRNTYSFFTSDLVFAIDAENLRKGVEVIFEPEGETKKSAKSIEISDAASAVRYELPDKFLYTRDLGFDQWQTIEIAREPISCRSAESYEAAMNLLIEKAKSYKANAIIDLKKIKSTKNKAEPYVCKGQFATVAKQSPRGDYSRVDLLGLNDRLKTSKGGSNQAIIWAGVGVAVALVAVVGIVLVVK